MERKACWKGARSWQECATGPPHLHLDVTGSRKLTGSAAWRENHKLHPIGSLPLMRFRLFHNLPRTVPVMGDKVFKQAGLWVWVHFTFTEQQPSGHSWGHQHWVR